MCDPNSAPHTCVASIVSTEPLLRSGVEHRIKWGIFFIMSMFPINMLEMAYRIKHKKVFQGSFDWVALQITHS